MHVSFLAYAPRSGSTHLASQIARYLDWVLVMPEFRLPEFLLERGDSRVRSLPASRLAALLRSDHQLNANLGLSSEICAQISERARGRGVAAVLTEVVAAYAPDFDATRGHVLFKLGRALAFHEAIRPVFPDVAYIHCYRDGRGVVNSLLHTRKAYRPDETMGRGDVVWSAKIWSQHMRLVSACERQCSGGVLHVRYEQFLADSLPVLRQLETVLDRGRLARSPTRQFVVGVAETPLHELVGSSADLSRTDAWKHELSRRDGVVAERIMHATLAGWGYGEYYLRSARAPGTLWAVTCAQMAHYHACARHIVNRVWQFRSQAPLVLRHLAVQRTVRHASRRRDNDNA